MGQFLSVNKSEADSSSFLINNLSLLIIILLGYLLFVTTTIVFPKLVHRNFNPIKSIRFVPTKVFFIDFNRLLHFSGRLAILLCAFNWFLFFNFNFLFGNIKTESMLVRTDDIIDSSSTIMSTKLVLTIIMDEQELLSKASQNSFLGKLNGKNIFVVGNKPDEERVQILNDITSYFFFERQIGLYYMMATFATVMSHLNLVAFMNPTIYHEAIHVTAIRKSLDPHKKRFIHQR